MEILKSLTLTKIDNLGSLTLTPNLDFEIFVMIFYKKIKKFDGNFAEIDKIATLVITSILDP